MSGSGSPPKQRGHEMRLCLVICMDISVSMIRGVPGDFSSRTILSDVHDHIRRVPHPCQAFWTASKHVAACSRRLVCTVQHRQSPLSPSGSRDSGRGVRQLNTAAGGLSRRIGSRIAQNNLLGNATSQSVPRQVQYVALPTTAIGITLLSGSSCSAAHRASVGIRISWRRFAVWARP